MPELLISVSSIKAVEHPTAAAAVFGLRISNAPEHEQVQTIALSCQFHLQAGRRRYDPAEQAALEDLFGEPERWSTTLRPLFWADSFVTVSAFQGVTAAEVCVPWPVDPNAAATKYFSGIRQGDVPVLLLFSGTVLYTNYGSLQMAPIPRSLEAACRLSEAVWKGMNRFANPASGFGSAAPTWQEMLDQVLRAGSKEL
ncbi:MAG: DUF6084 family protein [Terriglobia bacterium]